jgi:prepilin-type N-terminal cleavage/methylation domain-containing protein
MRRGRDERGGFTLIELMIVVVIIAVLAAVAIVAYTRHLKSSRLVDAKSFIAGVQSRQEMYFQQWGYYCDASGAYNNYTTDTWYPSTATGPFAQTWAADPGNNWIPLGARPESGTSYFQFLVRASAPPAHALAGSAATLGIPTQPTASDAGLIQPHPWYYVVGRANLDGGAGCSGGAPWVPGNEDECTFLWSTSARGEIVVGSEGR